MIQPNHIETVIAVLDLGCGKELWKYSRYFDNPQFWTNPGKKDDVMHEFGNPTRIWGSIKSSICSVTQKRQPTPDKYEMYNLTLDPLESVNLANPYYSNESVVAIRRIMDSILQEQFRKKRLSPSSGSVPGMPPCG